jgi:ribosomal protein S18 acetylase RimI-like enzyme
MMWWVGPSTQPSDLGTHLQEHGLIQVDESEGMALDLSRLGEDNLLPPGLRIVRVADARTLTTWMRIFRTGSGLPPFLDDHPLHQEYCARLCLHRPFRCRGYLGLLHNEPVATAALFAAGVAGIYNVATLAAARRQGIGTALTLAALREACALGYRIATLYATAMGASIYRRIGFASYCRFGEYVLGR